jgi:hypothetical protein
MQKNTQQNMKVLSVGGRDLFFKKSFKIQGKYVIARILGVSRPFLFFQYFFREELFAKF